MQRLCNCDHLLECIYNAAALLPHMDCDGNTGMRQWPQRFDQLLGRVKAIRRIAEAERDAQCPGSQLLFKKLMDSFELHTVELRHAEARGAGTDRPTSGQHRRIDPSGLRLCGFEIRGKRGKILVLRQRTRDRRQIGPNLFLICTAARRHGQTAVAVHDRGQSLLQLQLAEARPENGRVRVTVDIDEARRHILPCRVDHRPGGRCFQLADCRNAAIRNTNVRPIGRTAGTVDDLAV